MLISEQILALAPPSGSGGQESPFPMMIMFGAIILIMYFMVIRPQQKRQKETQKMIDALGKGDKVLTSAGMHGKIVEVKDDAFVVEVADNVKITFEKAAIVGKKD